MKVTAIYPGSFDPITAGHLDIIIRASSLFAQVIVAVVSNPSKQATFSLEQRVCLIQDALSPLVTAHPSLSQVSVRQFQGLTATFAKANKARVIVRGLRAVSDFESELMMSQMNHQLAPEIETVFLMANSAHQFISSSLVKEVSGLGGELFDLVPENVAEALKRLPKVLS